MKKVNLFKKIILLVLLYTIFNSNSSMFYVYAEEINNELDLVAESAVLIDAKTGIVIYEKNMNEKRYPASITKILTALIALEETEPSDIINHSFNAIYNIGPGGSNMGMQENEEIAMEDALYGVLLKSANEVCMAIAEFISGDVETFVNLMNTRAEEIGATNTHFANPHGYHDNNHYTTCYDIALIMMEAIKNDEFVKIISTENYTVPETNLSPERYLTNSNKLILEDSEFYYEYCIGGKTGFTDEAGNTLISYAKKDDIELIAVVMKDQGTKTYDDSIALFEYGFNQYNEINIFKKDSFETTIPVVQYFENELIDLGEASLVAQNDVSLALPNNIDINKISTSVELNETLIGDVNIGDVVGCINILYDNNIISSVNIVSTSEISSIPEEKLEKQKNIQSSLSTIFKLLIEIIAIILALFFSIMIIGFISRRYFKNKRKKARKWKY